MVSSKCLFLGTLHGSYPTSLPLDEGDFKQEKLPDENNYLDALFNMVKFGRACCNTNFLPGYDSLVIIVLFLEWYRTCRPSVTCALCLDYV